MYIFNPQWCLTKEGSDGKKVYRLHHRSLLWGPEGPGNELTSRLTARVLLANRSHDNNNDNNNNLTLDTLALPWVLGNTPASQRRGAPGSVPVQNRGADYLQISARTTRPPRTTSLHLLGSSAINSPRVKSTG